MPNSVCHRMTRVWLAVIALAISSGASAKEQLSFSRDVQPILSSRCYSCHGFDSNHRQADLRLDLASDPEGSKAGHDVIVPGDSKGSPLFERVTSSDPDLRMPPPVAGDALKGEEIAILERWIAQGAEYERHWAFVAPIRPVVPAVKNKEWVQNPIDAFVLAKLEAQGLTPSPRADSATLRRRLHLDLVGLPPQVSPSEDESELDKTKFGKLVDDLLASPHHGERWARIWLDAARYADSDGFEKDKPRDVWMYRDWVIDAFNANMPYDKFVVSQIAGDMLPERSQDDLVATGFLRNSMINEEGGADPEQFRMEALYDRMDAIGKGVLGLTLQCAQCHTHKYDPIDHADYYRVMAFLNNSYEGSAPVYPDSEERERRRLLREIRDIEQSLRASDPAWREKMSAWEDKVVSESRPEWVTLRPELDSSGGQKHYLREDGSVMAAGYSPPRHSSSFVGNIDISKITAVRVEMLADPDLPMGGPGRSPTGQFAVGELLLHAAPIGEKGRLREVKIASASCDVTPETCKLPEGYYEQHRDNWVTGPVEYAFDGKHETAWTTDIGPGRSNVSREAVFQLAEPIEGPQGVRLQVTLRQEHGSGNGNGQYNLNIGCFRFSITSAEGAKADEVPRAVREILEKPREARTEREVEAVFSYWRTTVAEWHEANARIEALWKQHPVGTSQLVLDEMSTPRPTYRHDRGDFLSPRERVTPGVPGFLHPLHTDGEPTRLDFARWLVDRQSPTTARSFVNRVWQAYFGTGFVPTVDDLGQQCEAPSHPELLDWLAVEFMESGWNIQHLHRLIVSSATYQQSSDVTPELLALDPDNRLLARGARFRVDAEIVRDIALASSGLLTPTVGGPSVYPPAPQFLFLPPASYGDKDWHYDTGEDKYRRALYTFRYRSVPYPALEVFDAPNGEFSCVRRSRSNTPLQALTTLNEPLFLECAQGLAYRVLTKGGVKPADRLQFAARCVLGRKLDETELTSLSKFVASQTERFATASEQAAALLGDRLTTLEGYSDAERAAWVATSRVLLNLDEAVTKE
jgi:hypothetical protein